MNIQQIPVTSTGHAYEVDFDALSDEIKLQLAIHGLKQKVNDCRGAWETDEEKDAASEKVLAAILAGEFRANSGARTSDPVGREVTRLATNLADQWARKQNGKLVSVRKSEDYKAKLAEFRKHPKVLEKAKAIAASVAEIEL
jgi:hypothetical protein